MSDFAFIAPPHSPFHSDGSLNLDAVEKQAAHFEQTGIVGVFVAGTTGESQSLTVQERLDLAKRWIDVCRSTDLQVIIQVGHNCIADAKTMAAHAERSGADAIASLAPSFLKPATVDDLIACCKPVAEAAANLPFYLYDIPAMTEVRLPMTEFLQRGKEQILNLKGLKFTNPDLVQLQECLHLNDAEFDILFGCDEILLTSALLGCRGAVGSTYNFCVMHYRAMMDAFDAGDLSTARDAQFQAVKMIRCIQKYSFLPAAKAIMSFLGIDCGPVRAPLSNLSHEQISELRSEFAQLEAAPEFAAVS
jgi:N-acetylneuraminate lyase